MPSDLDTVIATLREKYEAARQTAELYGQMLREVEAAAQSEKRGKKPRKQEAEKPAAPAEKNRATPVKAEVSASEAIVRLLTGCKMGLPGSEIIQSVATTYGYQRNSIRTTIYNLKKKGAIVQGEDGVYMHPENLG